MLQNAFQVLATCIEGEKLTTSAKLSTTKYSSMEGDRSLQRRSTTSHDPSLPVSALRSSSLTFGPRRDFHHDQVRDV